jgi:mannose-6-phosphate isomerase-like protein (cupin superfamily)
MAKSGWGVATISEIPPVKDDWPATWKSIRHHFGITAFGINGVTKDAGNVLVPEHNESESGQQEVFIVVEGSAVATLDGEQVEMSAGQIAAVEPGSTRKFESTSSPTTMVIVGAPVGKAYEVGAWEQ